MPTIDPATLKIREVYQLLIEAIVPRPIAFVSTLSPEGQGNLAPFSAFNLVSSNPPCLSIAFVRKRDGSKKDTLRNIEATGEFVVNTASESFLPQLVQCAAEYPSDIDEREMTGLTALPSVRVKPPRIGESPVQFECVLEGAMEIGDGSPGSSTLIVGRILLVHAADSAYRDGSIDLTSASPIGRLGNADYCRVQNDITLHIPRLTPRSASKD